MNSFSSKHSRKNRKVKKKSEKERAEEKKGKSSVCCARCSWREFKRLSFILSFHGWLPAHTNTAPRGRSFNVTCSDCSWNSLSHFGDTGKGRGSQWWMLKSCSRYLKSVLLPRALTQGSTSHVLIFDSYMTEQQEEKRTLYCSQYEPEGVHLAFQPRFTTTYIQQPKHGTLYSNVCPWLEVNNWPQIDVMDG